MGIAIAAFSYHTLKDILIASILFFITIITMAITISIRKIRDKVDLQCQFNHVAKSLEGIIKTVVDKDTKVDTVNLAAKRLYGLNNILTETEIEEDTMKQAKDRLKDCKSSFYAVSSASIADWFEPHFLTYFVFQTFRYKGKKFSNKKFFAERYLIYDQETINTYWDELSALKEINDLGEFKCGFHLLRKEILAQKVVNIIDTLSKDDKKILKDRKFPHKINKYTPDFLLIDGNYVYFRDENGDVIPSDDGDELEYYNALIKFFNIAKGDESICKPI